MHLVPVRHASDPIVTEVTTVSDRALARQAALGDRDAFAQIFRRHAAAMFRYALRMLDGNTDDAEEAVQEALAKAWEHLPQFRGESALRTWLFTITANVILAARRRRRPVAIDDDLLSAIPDAAATSPPAVLQGSELRHALERALAELPWRQRGVWLLREVEGLSYTEIAEVLETTPAVVRGQLHRARRTLAVRMVQWR